MAIQIRTVIKYYAVVPISVVCEAFVVAISVVGAVVVAISVVGAVVVAVLVVNTTVAPFEAVVLLVGWRGCGCRAR